ncbi:hypothetical protein K1719_044746 [Acacia pycnantha]|nr:hypothetical protein K1719_044746 [Acacia pycnantha]
MEIGFIDDNETHSSVREDSNEEDVLDDYEMKTADGQLVWANPQSEQIHANLQELRQQEEEEESDARMTSDEIMIAILGE